MNQLITMLLGSLKADKGRDVNRTLVLIGVIYCAIEISSLDKRMAVIEAVYRSRGPVPSQDSGAASPSRTNRLADAMTGPEWPKHLADGLIGEN